MTYKHVVPVPHSTPFHKSYMFTKVHVVDMLEIVEHDLCMSVTYSYSYVATSGMFIVHSQSMIILQ